MATARSKREIEKKRGGRKALLARKWTAQIVISPVLLGWLEVYYVQR